MRFCDFFSGIGGFTLGLTQAGHECVWACEIDRYCRQIYTQHFEEPQGKDINDVKAEEIPEADLWCGGFPCQDLSVAGKRGGLQANRSGLYWVWYELMRKRKPQWLLIENVPGLLSSPPNQPGADFGLLLSSLDEIGYGVAWRVLDAQFFGLAQRRKRVFVVGCFGKPCPPKILFEAGANRAHKSEGNGVAPTCKTGWGSRQNDGLFISHEGADAIRDGEDARLPRELDPSRYKALGNAVAVPVIKWIGDRLRSMERHGEVR